MAASFDQGFICFRHVLHFLAPALKTGPKLWRIHGSANRATVTDCKTGAMLRLHGAAPKLILADEVAQWPENLIDRMLAALETSRGKIPEWGTSADRRLGKRRGGAMLVEVRRALESAARTRLIALGGIGTFD